MGAGTGEDVKGVGEGVTEAAGEDPAGRGVAVAAATGVSKTGPDEMGVAVGPGPDVIGVSG